MASSLAKSINIPGLRHDFESGVPVADLLLFHDDFSDGLLHGWRPVHFTADVPQPAVSVETEYPFPGLFLATPNTAYRANAIGNRASTWKGLSGRFPTSGIISFSGLFAVQSHGPSERSWTNWGLSLDIQNWKDTQRATPTWLCSDQGAWSSRPELTIIDDSGTSHRVTGIANPVSGSTVSSTQYLFAGENQGKWDINYLRVSYDLGNLFTADSGLTSKYYEANINGYTLDLRTQAFGKGAYLAPQTASFAETFGGGLNAGVLINRSSSSTAGCCLIAGDMKLTYHATGWLA